jgi:hypothetical protein
MFQTYRYHANPALALHPNAGHHRFHQQQDATYGETTMQTIAVLAAFLAAALLTYTGTAYRPEAAPHQVQISSR